MPTVLNRKAADVTAWDLTDTAEMLDALSTLTARGWRGALSCSGETWRIELNADDPTRQVVAETGDWLILDPDLRRLTAAECVAAYKEKR